MPPPDRPPFYRVLVGGAILTIGVLILVPSGLCTAIMGLMAILQLIANPKELWNEVGEIGLLFLVVPAAAFVGFLLVRFGIAIGRR